MSSASISLLGLIMDKSPIRLTIGITGHRDILDKEKNKVATEFRALIQLLQRRYKNLGFRVVTGVAEGADQLITKTCIDLAEKGIDIEPVTVLPMPIEEYRKDFSGDALIELNDLIQKLNSKKFSIVELGSNENRNECYANLGRYLINKSDILVSVWNGDNLNDKGGTCDVTQLALHPLKRLRDNSSGEIGSGYEYRLNNYLYSSSAIAVYKIYAARSKPIVQAENQYTGFVDSYKNMTLSETGFPKQSHEYFSHLDKLTSELHKLEESDYYLCPDPIKYKNKNADLSNLVETFGLFDRLANNLKEKTQIFHYSVATLTIVLTALFLVYAKLYQNPVILGAYVATFLLGYAWYKFSKPNKTKYRYAFARAIAESLRIELFWRAKGIIDEVGESSLAKKISGQGLAEVRAISSIIKQATLLGKSSESDAFKQTTDVLHDWVIDQEKYYKTQKTVLSKTHHRYERIIQLTVIVPIALCLALLFFYAEFKHFQLGVGQITAKDFVVFLVGFIPILGAVCELHANNISVKELSFQYETVEIYLTKLAALINSPAAHENESKLLILAYETAGIELSREHIQWLVTTRQKNIGPAHGG